MTKKPDELVVLSELTRERDELETVIEELIADMAQAPPDARTSGDWASDGALTRRYLDLTNRQAELDNEIVALSRAITALAKTTLPN
jgi:hypothetical protein